MAQVGRRAFGSRGSRGLGGLSPLVRAGIVATAVVAAVALVLGIALGGPGGVEVERGAPRTAVATSGNRAGGVERDGGGASDAAAASKGAAGGGDSGAVDTGTASSPVIVHVDGAVQAPGVYELAGEGVRGKDAIAAAGGLAPDADTSALNLAQPLVDGEKLHVPRMGEVAQAPAATGTRGSGDSGSSGAAGSSSDTSVNINSATAAELDSLPGVGPSTAAAIVEERERNGPFSSPEDLMRVSGIGEKKFAKLKEHIRV